jgi:hypothetical protein
MGPLPATLPREQRDLMSEVHQGVRQIDARTLDPPLKTEEKWNNETDAQEWLFLHVQVIARQAARGRSEYSLGSGERRLSVERGQWTNQ